MSAHSRQVFFGCSDGNYRFPFTAHQLRPIFKNVPDELKLLRRWVPWSMEYGRDNKKKKKPQAGLLSHGCKWNDQKNQLPFQAAAQAFDAGSSRRRSEGLDTEGGLSFVLRKADGITVVDLDKCRDLNTGEIEPWASSIIARFPNTYTEISHSGTGVHVFILGNKPGSRSRCNAIRGVEIYNDNHLISLTGRLLNPDTPTWLASHQDALDSLYGEMFPFDGEPSQPPENLAPCPLADQELIEAVLRSRNNEKFQRLWRGDTSDYSGNHSSADLALCRILAFWAGPDATRIDRLFRRSGLYRAKWDRADYRTRTIKLAIDGCRTFMEWRKPSESSKACTCNGDNCDCPSISRTCKYTSRDTGTEQPEAVPISEAAEELVPGIAKPKVRYRDSPCRRIKVALQHRTDTERHRFSGFACNSRTCLHCGPRWLEDRIEWFGGIVSQFKPAYQTVTCNRIQETAVRKQIQRAGGIYVRIPMSNGQALWLTNVSIPSAQTVSQSDAIKSLTYALQDMIDLPEGSRVSCSRGLAFQRAKEPPTNEWRRLPHSGGLADFDAILAALRKRQIEYSDNDDWEFEHRRVTFRCDSQVMSDILAEVSHHREPPVWADPVRFRSGALVLSGRNRPMRT